MSIFDAITGNAYKSAAKKNTAAIQQGLATGTSALNSGADNALASLGTLGQGSALGALDQGFATARNDITAGYAGAAAPLAALGQVYNPLVQQGGNAYSAYSDAIGANGAAGNARATENFQAAPGYQYAMDQALEAVQRTAAARGGLAGGNATADILRTATGLADQGYQQYVNNLKGGTDLYTQGLAGQAQGLGAQANTAIGKGTALAALGTGLGTNRANLYGAAANVQNGLGTNIANLNMGATNALVTTNNNAAKATTDASGSVLGGLLGGLQSAFGAAGQAGGFKNLFTNPFA